MSKTIQTEAIVLKHLPFREADKFITLFTHEMGKISALAYGIRKLTSKKRASLEPSNRVKLLLVKSKDNYIIAESQLIDSYPHSSKSLTSMTQTYQLLEIVDILTAEQEAHPQVYSSTISLLESFNKNTQKKQRILETIKLILMDLGFGYPKDESENSLKNHIESIAQKPLQSKHFLIKNLHQQLKS